MAIEASPWILLNERQSWYQFSFTVTAANAASGKDTEEEFRTPILHLDRYMDTTPPPNIFGSLAISSLGQNLIAYIGSNPYTPNPPPIVDGASSSDWFCTLIDRVIENDNEGKNGVVRHTESWRGITPYYEAWDKKNGEWIPLTQVYIDALFSDGVFVGA